MLMARARDARLHLGAAAGDSGTDAGRVSLDRRSPAQQCDSGLTGYRDANEPRGGVWDTDDASPTAVPLDVDAVARATSIAGSAGLCAPPRLRHAAAAPPWLRVAHVSGQYRELGDWRSCLASLFWTHNETGNVWTHLAGGVFFTVATFQQLLGDSSLVANAPASDKLAFGVFLLCAQVCMFSSAAFHLFGCMSLQWYTRLYMVDMAGIAAMIAGSYVIGLHLGFACAPGFAAFYLVTLLSLLAVSMTLTLAPRFHGPEWVCARVTAFAGSVAFGLIPAAHWVVASEPAARWLFMPRLAGMFLAYAAGFVFWYTKFPERLRPGLFDNWLHSHQIWHVFVFLAALLWHTNMVDYYAAREAGLWSCDDDTR